MLICWAFVQIQLGVGAMVALSMWGGIGGNSGQSIWWALLVLTYPVGWLLGLFGVTFTLIESLKRRAQSSEDGQG